MRRILIFTLLFLLPGQLTAGSITFPLNGESKADGDNEENILFPSESSLYSGRATGEIPLDISSSPSAGYSASMLKEEEASDTGSSQISDISASGAAARSFLLPGLGQRKMGHSIRSKIYFFLEGAAWIGLGAFTWQSIARKDAYEDYAVAFAGVDGTGHSDSYYETIGNYMSNDGIGGYNEDVRREARDYYSDPDARDSYYQENSLTGDDGWRWETERDYDRYNSLRKGSHSAERRAIYTLFYMLGIRVISAVDAGRLASGGDSDNESASGISVSMEQSKRGVSLLLNTSF
ncbi:MAG: hypothetical protein U5O15_03480 [Candidatus Krumholzibacteriota bacterium]|nr:hypothetical protein [Candidatus Krumholzibacteriota bacterium]